MKQIIATLLVVILLFNSGVDILASQVNNTNSVVDEQGETTECLTSTSNYSTGLQTRKELSVPEEEIGNQYYYYEDLINIKTYSEIYNSEWDKYSTNYVYNRMSEEEKKYGMH